MIRLLLSALLALPLLAQSSAPLPRVRIILVGDSTVAVKNGWGPGFCADVVPEVACVNLAKNGRSTTSYRSEGLWDNVLKALAHNPEYQATYVLIQFGHNDQPGKPHPADPATEFAANLRRYVEDVKATGARPVLVTSLTRRSFKDGRVVDTLQPWADAAKRVAAEEHIPVLDLHAESLAAVQKMGPAEANTMAQAPPPAEGSRMPGAASAERKGNDAPVFDYTHLGEKGAAFFGRMVADGLASAVPELRPYFRK